MVPKAFLSRFLEILSNFFIRCGLFILMHFLYFASEQYSYTVFKWTRMVLSCQIPGEFPLNFMIYFFFSTGYQDIFCCNYQYITHHYSYGKKIQFYDLLNGTFLFKKQKIRWKKSSTINGKLVSFLFLHFHHC